MRALGTYPRRIFGAVSSVKEVTENARHDPSRGAVGSGGPQGLALAGKRHWGYPEPWLEAWGGPLTITPEYLAAHIVSGAED